MSELSRLVLDYRTGELVVRVLYRSEAGSNPGTTRRRREVVDLCCQGLRQALEALEGDAEIVGTSGFTTREDVLNVALPRPDTEALSFLPATANTSSQSVKGAR